MIVSSDVVMHYTPELETKETLKRERTRILQRTVVSSYRSIDYNDITDIQPMKRGGFGEIHTGEWSRLRVVLKRALVEHNEGVEQFEQEVGCVVRVASIVTRVHAAYSTVEYFSFDSSRF